MFLLLKKPALLFPYVLLIIIFTGPAAFAQGIKGTIRNSSGEPLPFASIYITNLQEGATSNANGRYEIQLKPGKYDILVQYIGYEKLQMQLEIKDNWAEKDFTLNEQAFVLREVEVNRKAEDPAYTIIRKAIAKKKYHLLQYDSYEVKVYMKGTGELKKAPFFLKNKLKEEGVEIDEAYTTESVSEIHFEQPDNLEEKVISIRSTGSSNSSPSPTIFIHQGFYKDQIADIISPLARSAFVYYKFKYEGSFREGDIEVNKIKVTPRSRGEQVFEGYIYIIEDFWAIHSIDLRTSQLGFKIHAKQNYAEVAPRVWMPVTHQYLVTGSAMGFAGEYKYLATCSDYKIDLNQDLLAQTQILDEKVEEIPDEIEGIVIPKAKEKDALAEALASEDQMTRKQFRKMMKEYEKESLKEQKEPEVIGERSYEIDSLAAKRDSAYWAQMRPVPLTPKEIKGYQRDDSLAMVESARLTGKDSAGVIPKKKFSPMSLVTGGKYNLSPRTNLRLNPTWTQVYFNTVEGVNVNMSARLRHEFDSLRQRIDISPVLRYGFSSKDFYAKTKFSYRRKVSEKTHLVSLEGGQFVQQFNPDEPIHPHINTLSSLLFRKNYMKIYEKKFLTAAYKYEASPAFSLGVNAEWAGRNELSDHTGYSFFFSDTRDYYSNQPRNTELENTGFPEHDALVLEGNVSYRPGLKYRIHSGHKYPLNHLSPELTLKYRKGINNLLGSEVDFDHIDLGLNHQFSFGVSGTLEFEMNGGTFLNNRKTYFMDYRHFDGNRTILSSLRPAGAFRLLDYYKYSTDNSYFSAHTHYQFRKLLFTRIPEVSFTGIRENIFVNYLKTSNSPHYYEVGYSLDRVFRILRIEVAASFEDRNFREMGLRIGVSSFIHFNSNDD